VSDKKQKMESQDSEKNQASQKQADEEKPVSREAYEALLQKVKELELLRDRMLRSAADFENAKKRLVKEKEEFSQFALESFFYDLLPVLDNFERALSHRGEVKTEAEKSIWNGIELIQKQLSELLKLRGLTRMDVLKKAFNPHFHEAMSQVESQTDAEGTIAEETVAGYLLYGKVLRPAKVKVFTKQKPADAEKIEEIT